MARGDDIKKILKLAKNMRASLQGYSIQDIKNECGGSIRTASRIKEIISDVFEVEEVPNFHSKTKKWRLSRGTLDSIIAFTADEIATLEDCQAYMKSQNYTNRCDLLPEIINKMRIATRKRSVGRDAEDLLEYHGFAVHQAPKIRLDNEVVENISKAMLEQKYLTFWYKNKKGEEKFRKVAPYAVIYSEYTYLVAKEDDSDIFKHFLLYKMKNVRIPGAYFEKDETFNLQEHMSKSFGAYQDKTPMKIKLLFSKEVREVIENYSIHPNQELELNPDGTTTVTFEAGGAYEICWFLFRWGKDVDILEPQELKDTYKKLLQDVMDKL
ncbi:MAG: WYL domain-containing protein [Cyanobacteria bacterium RUI128]|nr:WYL domain-containing protein [Cyanobacteria bacterium RUI128]